MLPSLTLYFTSATFRSKFSSDLVFLLELEFEIFARRLCWLDGAAKVILCRSGSNRSMEGYLQPYFRRRTCQNI